MNKPRLRMGRPTCGDVKRVTLELRLRRGPATTLERDPDKRAGSAWKAAGTRKGVGCKSSSFRSTYEGKTPSFSFMSWCKRACSIGLKSEAQVS